MKAFLVSSSSGSHGGGEFYLGSLASGLLKLGHDVSIAMSQHPQMDILAKRFEGQGIAISRIKYRNTYHRRLRSVGAAFDRTTMAQVADEFVRSSADIIHVNQQCLEDGLDLLKACYRYGKPAVSTVHVTRSAVRLGARFGIIRDHFARSVFKSCKVPLIGISPTSAGELRDFLLNTPQGSASSEAERSVKQTDPIVFSVPNGVAVPESNTGNREETRGRLGIKTTDFVVGVVARIEDQKNPLFMAELLAKLPDTVHVIWVGEGRRREQLESRIENLRLEKRFHLVGWQANSGEWFPVFDMFALVSKYEGLPLALLEAMAVGLPCVASHVDGNADCIKDGRDGFLCDVDDLNTWVGRLRHLQNDIDARTKLGLAAKLRHHDEFSLEAMAQNTADVYQQILRQK